MLALFACSSLRHTGGSPISVNEFRIVVKCQNEPGCEVTILNSFGGLHVKDILISYTSWYILVEAEVMNYSTTEIAQFEQRLRETACIISVTIKRKDR